MTMTAEEWAPFQDAAYRAIEAVHNPALLETVVAAMHDTEVAGALAVVVGGYYRATQGGTREFPEGTGVIFQAYEEGRHERAFARARTIPANENGAALCSLATLALHQNFIDASNWN